MFEKVDNMQDILTEILGEEELLQAVLKALSYDEKLDIFEYIMRMYDISTEEEETEEL